MSIRFNNKTLQFTSIFIVAFVLFFGVIAISTVNAESVAERKTRLEAELAQLEAQIQVQEAILAGQKNESSSIQKDVSVLTAEISKARLNIKSKNVAIQKLGGEITSKTNKISSLSNKIIREKESLGQLIRRTNVIDDLSLIHLVLSKQNLSRFYVDLDSFSSIKASVKDSIDEINGVKVETAAEKASLTQKQNRELDAKKVIETEKRSVQKKESAKKELLSISKNKEKAYEAVIADREKKAAEIRSALFSLRDTAAIPFGKAYEYALLASEKTGVRPAFILAILTQESNLGQNVGSCFLRDTATGDGVGKNTGKVIKRIMKPTRDVAPFLDITKSLGIDPFTTPVSCPWVIGFGGAMGPSQFIPSTWAIFKSRIAKAVGVNIPNPWNPQHAIMATGIFMDDLGADKQTFTAERDAACRYFSGRGCMDPKVKNLFYGNSVMNHAKNIQENMIDPLLNL
ncbi:hypothetical protein COB64_03050 [Candidatus Wolfebacteria bacterium]|nr:MAG: hypothetical protein COB64_03050 [Candidatus Wolfebacteria bacterium]